MNLLDYILLAILVYCFIRGLFKGLVGEVSAIIGVLAGFYGAYTYYPIVSGNLDRWITHPVYQKIIGFTILFIGIYIAIAIVAALIKHLMNISFLGWTDRTGGAVFGVLKGAIIAIILIMMLTVFLPGNSTVLSKSVLSRHLMRFSAAIAVATPKEMKSVFSAKMKELNQTWKHRDL